VYLGLALSSKQGLLPKELILQQVGNPVARNFARLAQKKMAPIFIPQEPDLVCLKMNISFFHPV
jgi:hypothetical protein